MKKIAANIFLFFQTFLLFSQNTIGVPDIINYSKFTYKAGLQNWDFKQDSSGIIYVANNEGLLSFDGQYWKLYPLPNKTIVRSLEIGNDRIYVGGQDELGYFSPTINGELKYHSLTQFIDQKNRAFSDVWDISIFGNDVFFRCSGKIFKFSGNNSEVYDPILEWAFMTVCNGNLYAQDLKEGIMIYKDGNWSPVFSQNLLPANDPVTSILPGNAKGYLITTLKSGLFIMNNETIEEVKSASNNLFKKERIYAAAYVNETWIALATSYNGVHIVDRNGEIIQSFSMTEGLQNNNVLNVFLDRQNNLWLGLDNGIDLVSYNSAIKQINPLLLDGSGYSAAVFKNNLYIAISGGLYKTPLQKFEDLSFCKGAFTLVSNSFGQTWGLNEINNELLLGHHEGAFLIKDNYAEIISPGTGYWTFVPLSNTFPTSFIAGGNYKGLTFFEYTNGEIKPVKKLQGFDESSRYIITDKNGNIWISHPYHGVYKLDPIGTDFNYTIKKYTDAEGLPSSLNNHVYKIRNEVVVGTEKGIYILNDKKNQFEPSAYYKEILGDLSIRYLKEDKEGNIWFIHEKNLGVIDLSAKQPQVIYLPELNNKMLSGFEFIYPLDNKNIFLGGEKGFFHINYEKYKKTFQNLSVQIRNVRIVSGTRDSLLFGGYRNANTGDSENNSMVFPEIKNKWKTIRFEFASASFGFQSKIEYSFRLNEFDEAWSEWSNRTDKEYTNLPPGNYTFTIKVRNNLGNESSPMIYKFRILPPWYQTTWMKIIYILIFISVILSIVRWQRKKFQAQQKKYEDEQKKLQYIHELEKNKAAGELMNLKNEKLETEVNFKNTELASSAMHLVKKGELLTKLKDNLSQLMKDVENPHASGQIKKMIKTLSEDENLDKEWENFAVHFNNVHSNYLVQLKKIHPSISPNELKLCAYLRMNLSTKEIAQLMNISVRGVEISRYRLRKKLQLQSETNLFDYLISIQD